MDTTDSSKEDTAEAGIVKLEEFIKMLKLPLSVKELGATEEMLPLIAKSTVPGGAYKYMEAADILEVLKKSF